MAGHVPDAPDIAALILTLRSIMGPESDSTWSAAFVLKALRLLSNGRPVDLQDISGRPAQEDDRFEEVVRFLGETNQLEFDESHRLVAVAGLSLRKTNHSFRLGPVQLYTWCAIDTLFLPKLLDRRADIVSKCPVSGVEIRLAVSPDQGIEALSHEDAVVSIVDPGYAGGETCSAEKGACGSGPRDSGTRLFGEDGAFCGNVFFFRSQKDAEKWHEAHPEAILLPAADALRVAVAAWADPLLEKSVLS
jgi:alkylmercury lyase